MNISRMMQTLLISFLTALLLSGCSHDKLELPVIPPGDEQFKGLDDAEYVLLSPILDASNGYSFRQPSDVFFGADNFLYVADTGNDRIVMLDAGGAVQGISGYLPHPEAITQNDSLQLLIVNNSNVVYRIDLFKYAHDIAAASIDTVFHFASEPTRQFTGISVHNRFEYYVTAIDVADSSTNFREFNFIYDFTGRHTLKGPLPLNVNGSGLYSAILPTSVLSLRERWLDISVSNEDTPAFYFTQIGRTSLLENNFPFQHVTTVIVEGDEMLTPNISYVGTDLYGFGKFRNAEDAAVDRSGFIFVLDGGRALSDPDTTHPAPGFYRFSSTSGKQLQTVTGLGSGILQFNHPRGIAVLPDVEGQIVYVADTGNNRIMMFQLSTDL